MPRYVVGRLFQMIWILLGVCTILFFVLRLSGDPIGMLLPDDASTEARQDLRRSLGLDRPLHIQYVRYLAGLARFNFGESFKYRQPALDIVTERLPATVGLTVASLLFSLLVAIPIGILAAVKRHSLWSVGAMIIALGGQSIPSFWLGILLILLFAVHLHLLPSFGSGGLAHLIMPAVTLSGLLTARVTRLVRSGVLSVLAEDFVRTAHAKGLAPWTVLWRHVLRNVLIPVVTVVGLEASHLMGGAVVTETVFAWPGIGRQLVTSVIARDYPIVQAIVVMVAVIVVAVNLAVDVLYGVLDPRIRLGGRR